MQISNWKSKVPETFERIEPLVEAMMAKFPPEMNIQGFDPALTQSIAEIVAQENERVQKESIERAIEVLPKPIEPVSSEGVDGYNEAIARSVEALKTLLH